MGTELAGEFKKLFNAQRIQIHSTMTETKAGFAERTMRLIENFLYCYKQDYGYKYIHMLPQLVTTLISRKKWSVDSKPKDVKVPDFLSILYNKPLREYRKPKCKIQIECASPV